MTSKLQEMIELGEAIKATKKLPRIISNNEGAGFSGQAYIHYGNEDKARKAYNAMHSKVKKTAVQHLYDAKKPNIMVRDYLDSKYGRHLHDMHLDGKADNDYINRSFKDFKKEYKPELFKEEVVSKGNLVNVHVNWTGDYGSKDHFYKQFPSMKHAKKYTSDFEKKEKYRPVWRYEPTNSIRESNNDYINRSFKEGILYERSLTDAEIQKREKIVKAIKRDNPEMDKSMAYAIATKTAKRVAEEYLDESDDHAGMWEIQGHDGRYKKIRIKTHPKFGYQIHLGSNSVLNASKEQVKSFIHRNNAMPINEADEFSRANPEWKARRFKKDLSKYRKSLGGYESPVRKAFIAKHGRIAPSGMNEEFTDWENQRVRVHAPGKPLHGKTGGIIMPEGSTKPSKDHYRVRFDDKSEVYVHKAILEPEKLVGSHLDDKSTSTKNAK